MKTNPTHGWKIANLTKIKCQFCSEERGPGNIKKHEDSCYLNPINKRCCDVCGDPVKNFRKSVTCSYSCANTKFKSGPNNPNWKDDRYTTTCFHFHKKECVVCGENKIVAVHHLDENHHNNSPENLIPMCPTHHAYWHSQYKSEVESIVTNYLLEWQKSRH